MSCSRYPKPLLFLGEDAHDPVVGAAAGIGEFAPLLAHAGDRLALVAERLRAQAHGVAVARSDHLLAQVGIEILGASCSGEGEGERTRQDMV